MLSDAEKDRHQEEYDPRLPEAIEIVIEAGQASISMLQRRMGIGYARAGQADRRDVSARHRERGEPAQSPRTVLITREQYLRMFDEEEK